MIAEIEQSKTAWTEMSSDYRPDSAHDHFLCKTRFQDHLLKHFCIFRASARADQNRFVCIPVNAGSHDIEETLDRCLAAMNSAKADEVPGIINIPDRLELQEGSGKCSNIG